MDKRKRTLKSRRNLSNVETNCVAPKQIHAPEQNFDAESIQGKPLKTKQSGQCQPSTPKRELPGKEIKLESPVLASPLQSPGYQTMFPKSYGSPEIEVSWDWGCSQVSREMLPPRLKKKIKTPQPIPILVPNVIYGPRIAELQISEEENQERLAFYKNILSKSSKCTPEDSDELKTKLTSDSAIHSNLNSENCITPKRHTLLKENQEDQMNALFDDSANELMFECSQAVEEKLANGEIIVKSCANVNIPNQKHHLSPLTDHGHINKKVCHGKSKLNLFPETSKNINSIGEHIPKENQCISVSSAQFTMSKPYCNLKPTKLIESLKNKSYDNVITESTKQEVVICKKKNGQDCGVLLNNNYQKNSLPSGHPIKNSKLNQRCLDQVPAPSSISLDKRHERLLNSDENTSKKNWNVNNNNEIKTRVTELDGKLPDVTSLLEDEFDNELSSIDFDSLCDNSLKSGSHYQTKTATAASFTQAPKICSQQEIEAKRLAALNRLKMKKK